jgi:predicted molibdopterin-dependent oxidoreductase YjgC
MGALPNVFPGYQKVNNPTVNAKFSKAWGKRLDEKPGLTLTDMLHAAHKGKLRAMYVVGENPLMSEPDLHYAREAMARLQFLAVQDLFLTETAQLADVVLPAAGFAEKDGTFTSTERRVQLIRKAIDPPGKARPDWEIVSDLSSLFGYPMKYSSSAEIMSEISELTPIYGGISHDRLNNNNGLQWPCWTHSHAGTATLHKEQFTRGKGQFHVVHDKPPAEYPSNDYPLLLTTGRVLEHWHTGSMSHRSHVLESLVSESNIEINPTDADHLGIIDGDIITVSSRRGKIQTKVRKTRRVQEGLAFMAFHWSDAPANLLTNSAVDPLSKIPEYKVSSVNAMLTVLESAAMNNAFLMAFIKDPLKALEVIHLTTDQKKALFAGDISMIENQVGALEERLKAWIISRLAQEMR